MIRCGRTQSKSVPYKWKRWSGVAAHSLSQFPTSESDDQVWPHTRCVHAMLSTTQGNVSPGFVMFWKSNKSRLVSKTTTNRQLFPATPEYCANSFQKGIVFPPATSSHSSGAVWESRWTSWAVRPNEPSGFRGRKDLLNRASALVTTCP